VQNAIGEVIQFRDDREAALASYEHALQLYQQIGDRLGEANCYLAQGSIALKQEKYEKCLTLYTDAYSLYQQIEDSYSQCASLYYRSYVYEAMDKRAFALQDVEAALVIAEHLALPQADLLREWHDTLTTKQK
jgi:tetratricopeptide (TPR) repeat protein